MRLLVIFAYSDDLCAEVLEFLIRVPELAGLRCASFREVFRIEVDDDVLLSVKVFEANVLASTGLQSEYRCRASYLYHRLHPFKVFLLSPKTDRNTRRQNDFSSAWFTRRC